MNEENKQFTGQEKNIHGQEAKLQKSTQTEKKSKVQDGAQKNHDEDNDMIEKKGRNQEEQKIYKKTEDQKKKQIIEKNKNPAQVEDSKDQILKEISQIKVDKQEEDANIEQKQQQIEKTIKKQVIEKGKSQEKGQQKKIKKQSKKKQSLKKEEKDEENQNIMKKTEEVKKEQTPIEIIQNFFANPESKSQKQIKWSIVSVINELTPSKIFIKPQSISKYLNSQHEKHSYDDFKQWNVDQEKKKIQQIIKQFRQTKQSQQIKSQIKKIESIVQMTSSNSSILNISCGIGQSKGKSSIKLGMQLQESIKENFEIQIEMKCKKKAELKIYLENQLKKAYKSTEYTSFSLFKYTLTETEKNLKLVFQSNILEEQIFKSLFETLKKQYSSEEKPEFKVEADLIVKNSIKSEEGKLQNKKIIKWMTQGMASHLTIKGNGQIIKHFTYPLGELFPILKVIKAGDINLKLRHCENVQKFFDKLGINELCEETPSLSEFAKTSIKEYLDSDFFVVGDIIKKALLFVNKISNERIGLEVAMKISHLNISLSLSGDSCREIADLILASLEESL